jgi:DNA-binding transcriptional regulator YiaG
MTDHERAFLALVALGYFSVDAEGRIWRHREFVGGSRTGGQSYSRARQPTRAESSRSSYPKVMFQGPTGRVGIYAHRIVWMVANQEDIPDGMEVNHKDGNKMNAHPLNLELVTHAGNTLHSFRELGQKVKEQRGVKNTSAKLDEAKVLEIRSLCADRKLSQTVIAQMFGVTQRTVSEIHLRKTWRHVP